MREWHPLNTIEIRSRANHLIALHADNAISAALCEVQIHLDAGRLALSATMAQVAALISDIELADSEALLEIPA